MPLNPEQLASALGGTLAPLYLLAGEEPLLVVEAADAVRAAARRAGFTERVVYEVERGFDWSVLRGEAASLSLFAERRLLELRLGNGKLDPAASAALCDYAAAPSQDVLLLLTGDAFDRRTRSSAWFSACERAGVAMYAWPLEPAALPRWLSARAAARGLTLKPDGASVLAELTEGNLLAAAQEVDKLVLLSEPGATLDRDGVLQVVGDSARYAVRDLADAALAGDRPRLTRAIAHLKDAGETPILALWQLTQDLQRLCDGTAHGQPPRRRELLDRVRRRRPAAYWQRLLVQAAAVDRANKGVGEGADAWQQLTALALRLAGPGAPGAGSARAAGRQAREDAIKT
ncbi:MAG: DNA polymerase III subunit delta [Immundisolibacter sp.]